MGNGSSFNPFPPPGTKTAEGSYARVPSSQFDVNLSKGLSIPPPNRRPDGSPDETGMLAYYYSSNLCWLIMMLLIILLLLILGGVLDAGLRVSWTSHGSKRLNDRSVPVSSIHKGNFELEEPTFVDLWSNSTTATPAIWDGVVFYCSWDGQVTGVHEHTGEVHWTKSICEDYFGLDPTTCYDAIQEREYISVATPTMWGGNAVISIRKPPGFVVVDQKTGVLVKKSTLSDNEHAIVTQSGTVWDDSYLVGTSISEREAWEDAEGGCTFIGEMIRWNLDTNEEVWRTSMEDPYESHVGEPSGFTGMPIRGSSPALSVKKGLIAISVGPLVCRPDWYETCLSRSPCGEGFDASAYRTRYSECYDQGAAKYALFNSVVLLRYEDGSLYWHEKMLGHRAWSASCYDLEAPFPCSELLGHSDEGCGFKQNPYLNCPTEEGSCDNPYEFVDDPSLQVHSGGEETLYVQQHSGTIYAFRLEDGDSNKDHVPVISDSGYDFSRLRWARSVSRGRGGGGIAVDKRSVYFSAFNSRGQPWIYGEGNVTTYCGGWGSIETSNGLPLWYKPHPLCNTSYTGCAGDPELPDSKTGGRAPPAITNDLVLVTSDDTTRRSYGEFAADWDDSLTYCGGWVYALGKSDGAVFSSYQTGEPFGDQGFSIHGRCAYAGNGPNPSKLKATGKKMFGWCVEQAYATE